MLGAHGEGAIRLGLHAYAMPDVTLAGTHLHIGLILVRRLIEKKDNQLKVCSQWESDQMYSITVVYWLIVYLGFAYNLFIYINTNEFHYMFIHMAHSFTLASLATVWIIPTANRGYTKDQLFGNWWNFRRKENTRRILQLPCKRLHHNFDKLILTNGHATGSTLAWIGVKLASVRVVGRLSENAMFWNYAMYTVAWWINLHRKQVPWVDPNTIPFDRIKPSSKWLTKRNLHS